MKRARSAYPICRACFSDQGGFVFTVDTYLPTRIIFGAGRLKELATAKLPGKKALVCVTADGLMKTLGIQDQVLDLLAQNGVETVIYDKVYPNPSRESVMEAVEIANREGCDFFFGLGGGSSIDTAKAVALVHKLGGELWDYASTGTGGRKEVTGASPIVTVGTTCGTGTEVDQYCVITKLETAEKLDFTVDALFPTLSVIDPELMLSLPKSQTMYQGFDAFFHNAECYMTNNHRNRLLDLYSVDGFKTAYQWLPKVLEDGSDLEARTNMSYAANILGGYSMGLDFVTTHHIIAQSMGGVFPKVAHGATLIFIAKEFYKRYTKHFPEFFDEMGEMLGTPADPSQPGTAFCRALDKVMAITGADQLKMSDFGIDPAQFQKIADVTVDVTEIDWDRYVMSKEEIVELLEASYR
ncbi:MAG: iron-containing alcohol dehydrogenase [Propionibacterium sp.]|nr:iron-containing alcohol dehydrogenase [Propionibacterium sp.]